MSEPTPEREALFAGDPRFGTPVIGLLYVGGAVGILFGGLVLTRVDLPPANGAAIFGTLGGAWIWASVLILRAALRRKGWVEVFPDRLTFRKDWRRVTDLPWDQVAGYSLPAEGYVQVHREGEPKADPGLTIPTPDPDQRAAAVALLEARGVHLR